MQLGELQHQIARFERRGVTVVALSVDPAPDSVAMARRLGLTFDLGSDPDQRVVKAFGVQNPDTRELALHAVYIVDRHARVFYRKVGRRRPVSAELIDAVDAHRGAYPQDDGQLPRRLAPVAYPTNEFQALLEMTRAPTVPPSVDEAGLRRVLDMLTSGRSDPSVIAFRQLTRGSAPDQRDDLYTAVAWMTRLRFIEDEPDALALGQELDQRLVRLRQLEADLKQAQDESARDEALHTLARARAGLSSVRARISERSGEWNLRYAKTMLRSYRELARAATEPEA